MRSSVSCNPTLPGWQSGLINIPSLDFGHQHPMEILGGGGTRIASGLPSLPGSPMRRMPQQTFSRIPRKFLSVIELQGVPSLQSPPAQLQPAPVHIQHTKMQSFPITAVPQLPGSAKPSTHPQLTLIF